MKNKNTNKRQVKKINEEEKAFCHYFLDTFNAKFAAKKAGLKSENQLQKAHELLQQTHIKAYLRRLQKEKQQQGFVGAWDVVQKYAQLAFADLNDYLTQNCDEVQTSAQASTAQMSAQANGGENFDGTLISEIKKSGETLNVKLPDRMKALAWLSDYFELNPQDVFRREFEKRKLELEALKIVPNELIESENTQPEQNEPQEQNLQSGEGFTFNQISAQEFINDGKKNIDEIWNTKKAEKQSTISKESD